VVRNRAPLVCLQRRREGGCRQRGDLAVYDPFLAGALVGQRVAATERRREEAAAKEKWRRRRRAGCQQSVHSCRKQCGNCEPTASTRAGQRGRETGGTSRDNGPCRDAGGVRGRRGEGRGAPGLTGGEAEERARGTEPKTA
jgi:hypothetical protein